MVTVKVGPLGRYSEKFTTMKNIKHMCKDCEFAVIWQGEAGLGWIVDLAHRKLCGEKHLDITKLELARAVIDYYCSWRKAELAKENIESELAILSNRYHWHTSIELPPNEIICIGFIGKTPHVCTYDYKDKNWYDIDGDAFAKSIDYWRVLDLPEENSNDHS